MILTDGDIVLRPLEMADAADLYAAASESIPELSRWLPWCHENYSIEETRAFLASRSPVVLGGEQKADPTLRHHGFSGEWYSFGIRDRQTERFLGGVGLNFVNRVHQSVNLGYWVRTSATGHGVASRATRLVAKFALEQLGVQRVEIIVATGNLASQRVAEKAGAVREGVARKRLLIWGEAMDAVVFSLVREDLG